MQSISAGKTSLLCVVILSSMAAASGGASPDAESLPALVKRVKPAVVTIVAYDPEKAMPSLGTGCFVAADRIVSARHVLAATDRAEIRTAAGGTFRVRGILAEDRKRDLVLIEVEKPPTPPTIVEMAPQPPEAGEKIFTIGTPLGFEWSVSEGVVSAYRDVPGCGMLMQHTTQITVGSSGGALFNLRGQVVGVQIAMMTEGKETISAGQGLNFAVALQHVAALKAGQLRTIAQCASDLPEHWLPPITKDIVKTSLYPLTSDNFSAAEAFFVEATVRMPDEPDAWLRLGICQEKNGKPERAQESYLKALALRPDFALALNNLGAVYNGGGRYDEAIVVLQKAVKADENLGEAYNSMAFAYYHTKKYPQAAESAEKALKFEPKHVDARYHLALACHQMGQKDKALEHWKTLRTIDKKKAEELKRELDKAKP